MKKGVVIGVIAIILIVLVAGYFIIKTPEIIKNDNNSLNPVSNSSGFLIMVLIRNFNFDPTSVNIFAGETITWENQDSAKHTIVFDSENISSPDLNSGERFSRLFNASGTYNYHCGLHTSMKGTVVVS